MKNDVNVGDVMAAPVGELREAFEAKYPAAKKLTFHGGVYLSRLGNELLRSVRDGINDAWNACLDEFARLNGAGSHE